MSSNIGPATVIARGLAVGLLGGAFWPSADAAEVPSVPVFSTTEFGWIAQSPNFQLPADGPHHVTQHPDHPQRGFAAAIVAGHPDRLDERELAIKRVRGCVGCAQLDVHRRHAGRGGRFDQPFDHPAADAAPLMRGLHGEENEVRALVADAHDGKAGGAPRGPRNERHRIRIANQRGDARCPVAPAEPRLDQIARERRELRRVVAVRESELDVECRHGGIVPSTSRHVGNDTVTARPPAAEASKTTVAPCSSAIR